MQTTPSATACAECCDYRNSWGFLRQIEMSLPEDLGVHPILDTDCTHKHDPDRRSSAPR